jgi:glucosyl-dolichyl phosphate glucuronosyltransferase
MKSVVDNASTDATRGVVGDWVSRDSRISYIYEPAQGVAHARNTAVRRATAPLIAFTDDDQTVPENWVSLLISGLSSLPSSVFALGGEIDPVFESERPDWLTDKLLRPLSARLGWSETPRFLQGNEWIGEGNSAYRTELLRKYGGFTEELGRQGDLLLSSENFVNDVARRDGCSIYFDPGIRITHFIPASRLTKEWFRRRYFWQGVTSSMIPRIAESRYGFIYDHLHKLHLPISPWIGSTWSQTNAIVSNSCRTVKEFKRLVIF